MKRSGIEPALEIVHRLAGYGNLLPDMELELFAGSLDPFELFGGQEEVPPVDLYHDLAPVAPRIDGGYDPLETLGETVRLERRHSMDRQGRLGWRSSSVAGG